MKLDEFSRGLANLVRNGRIWIHDKLRQESTRVLGRALF